MLIVMTASGLTQTCYMQPARLLQPVRHALGFVLLRANKPKAAEQVYRENLAEHPANGFALLGLSQSLAGQGKTAEASHVQQQLKMARLHADANIASSAPAFSVI